MNKSNYLKTLVLVAGISLSFNSFAQTKAEKKVKAKGQNTGMYNGSESQEAMDFYTLGEQKHHAEDYKEAVKYYQKAIKADPKFVEAYDNIAVCYRRQGDFKNAIKNYQKSIELYPNGTMAHQNLGLIYGIQKEYDKAIAEYEAVQKIEPENAEGYYGTINIYLAKNEFKNAVKAATKTLEIYEATNDPFLPDAQYLLGLSYYYDNDNKNAKIYIEQAKKSGVNVPAKLLADLEIK
jgi:tetratricopeptide (TPR) repeat protein